MKFAENDIVVCNSLYLFLECNLSPELVIGKVYRVLDSSEYNKEYCEVWVEHCPGEFEWFKDTCFEHIKVHRDSVIDNILN